MPLSPAASRAVGVAWCPGNYRPAAADAFRSFVLDQASRVAAGRSG